MICALRSTNGPLALLATLALVLNLWLTLPGCEAGTIFVNPLGSGTDAQPLTDMARAVAEDGGGSSGGDMAMAPMIPTDCVPSNSGKDYQVGSGPGQLTELDQVPWEALAAGDTVRIFHRAAPYVGKFMIAARGTALAPVRICGVKGLGGERPIIDGQGATTRAALHDYYGNKQYDRDVHQGRTLILIKHNGSGAYTDYPAYIQIDGLAIRRSHPDYRFNDAKGVSHSYSAFGACVWIERGHHISIVDNEISDCSMAIFSKSSDDGDFAVTRDVRVANNTMSNCGIVGDEHMHTTYMQSAGITYEFNHYGALRPGASGNSLKDRSVAAVVRFNRIDDGAHAIDLVEAEDYPLTAMADPRYRSTFVYGNQISKSGESGSFIHYGGDHYGSIPGANWGEPLFRKGTLYFFHNTLYATGRSAVIFQLATTQETAEVWNNVIVFAPTIAEMNLRASTDIGASWIAGGIVNLGRNWISTGWQDSDVNHVVPGQLNGQARVLSGASPPVALDSFVPLLGSAVIDVAEAGPVAAAGYPVDFQLDARLAPVPRVVKGTAGDLGALEL